jgi:hypothetical protein
LQKHVPQEKTLQRCVQDGQLLQLWSQLVGILGRCRPWPMSAADSNTLNFEPRTWNRSHSWEPNKDTKEAQANTE